MRSIQPSFQFQTSGAKIIHCFRCHCFQQRTNRLRTQTRWPTPRSKCNEMQIRQSHHAAKSNSTPWPSPRQWRAQLENEQSEDGKIQERSAMHREVREKLFQLNQSFTHAMKKLIFRISSIFKPVGKSNKLKLKLRNRKNRKGVSRLSFLKRPRPFLQFEPQQKTVGVFSPIQRTQPG